MLPEQNSSTRIKVRVNADLERKVILLDEQMGTMMDKMSKVTDKVDGMIEKLNQLLERLDNAEGPGRM